MASAPAAFVPGPRAVFANGNGSLSSIITDLFMSDKTVAQMFQDDRSFSGAHDFKFASKNTSWATAWMDPYARARYYHSVVGTLTLTAAQVRAG